MWSSEEDLIFLYELAGLGKEFGFIQKILLEPNNKVHREYYAEWLEEHDRMQSADLVRKGFLPYPYKPKPMYPTIASGAVGPMIISGGGLYGPHRMISG